MCPALEKYASAVIFQHYYRRILPTACFELKAVKSLNPSAVKIRAASWTATFMDGLEAAVEKHWDPLWLLQNLRPRSRVSAAGASRTRARIKV